MHLAANGDTDNGAGAWKYLVRLFGMFFKHIHLSSWLFFISPEPQLIRTACQCTVACIVYRFTTNDFLATWI